MNHLNEMNVKSYYYINPTQILKLVKIQGLLFDIGKTSYLLLCFIFASSYVVTPLCRSFGAIPDAVSALAQIICQANIDICQPTGVWILTTFRQDECLYTFAYSGLHTIILLYLNDLLQVHQVDYLHFTLLFPVVQDFIRKLKTWKVQG